MRGRPIGGSPIGGCLEHKLFTKEVVLHKIIPLCIDSNPVDTYPELSLNS